MLASAIAGRTLAVAPGAVTFADGETVFVASDDPEHIRRAVTVQAALLASDSLAPAFAKQLRRRRRGVVERYLVLEAARSTQALGRLVAPDVAQALRELVPSLGASSPTESLQLAAESGPVPSAPAWLGTILAHKLVTPDTQAVFAPTDADLRGDVTEKRAMAELDEDEDGEDGLSESKILKLLSAPLGPRNPLFSLFKSDRRRGGGKGEGQGEGSQLPISGAQAVKGIGSQARLALVAAPFTGTPPPRAPGASACYPEWDGYRGSYRQAYCHVYEYDPARGRGEPIGPRENRQLRRRLARVSLELERHRRQSAGDDLDLDALVGLEVSRAAGFAVADRIYQTRLHTKPDLGVLVLLDASGSTGETRADGTRTYDVERHVAADLVGALEDLGYRSALYGFNSQGPDRIKALRVKAFDDRFGSAACERLGNLQPDGFTRIGAALRHGAHLLETGAGVGRRLIVLISDGYPYDDGYEHSYAEADTKRALAEAQANHIGCACLNFAPLADDARLERIFARATYVRLADADEFVEQAHDMFTTALKAVTRIARAA
jgi:Mg-chelatase subunit ChlD